MGERLTRWLMNRFLAGKLAPPLPQGATCEVPGCVEPAAEQWWPGFCALREARVELAWTRVCAEHDVELNEQQVRFLFGSRYEAALADYRNLMLSRPGDE